MALNIKDQETERLAAEVAAMTGETKTGAVRVALQERAQRLGRRETAGERLLRVLEEEIRPRLPSNLRGRRPLTKEKREEILGYGPDGV